MNNDQHPLMGALGCAARPASCCTGMTAYRKMHCAAKVALAAADRRRQRPHRQPYEGRL